MPKPSDSFRSSERTALYRLYDAEGVLLYVGITSDTKRRWEHHAAIKTWWPEVARKTVEWFESRLLAGAAEVAAITAEAPRYNGQHAPSPVVVEPDMRRHHSTAPYLQLAATLRVAIRQGEYPVGTKLPTIRELKARFTTSAATAQRAINELKNEGLVEGRTGAGVFVLAVEGRTVRVPLHDMELAAETLRRSLNDSELLELVRLLSR